MSRVRRKTSLSTTHQNYAQLAPHTLHNCPEVGGFKGRDLQNESTVSETVTTRGGGGTVELRYVCNQKRDWTEKSVHFLTPM